MDLFLEGTNSLCVSKLFTCCLCVLLSPVVTTHTPPSWAGTVHLQDTLTWHQTHWRGELWRGKEKRSHLSSFCFCVCVDTDKVRQSQVFVLPGNVVLTVKLDTQVISSSPPVQSSFPSQALSSGMNLTERMQKKYLLSISCLTGGQRSGTLKNKRHVRIQFCLSDLEWSDMQWMTLNPSIWQNLFLWCVCDMCVLGRKNYWNCGSLKYPAVASIPNNTTTVRTVSNTLFLLDALSFWVFGAVMGLLWRPGCGTTRNKREKIIIFQRGSYGEGR